MTTRYLPPLRPRARGMALPVVLIILAVMLLGGIYLLKSAHSTALTTGNLAYDATLGREADLGLQTAFQWLSNTAAVNKSLLNTDQGGYTATFNTTLTPNDDAFWTGHAAVPTSDGTVIWYVIHRLCTMPKAYNESGNLCLTTVPNTTTSTTTAALGSSLSVSGQAYAGTPLLHYVITSRIQGGRGANVTNQMIVQIGA